MTVLNERVVNLQFDDSVGEPTEEGQVKRVGTDLRGYFGGTPVSLLSGTGISEADHSALRQLIHFIDDGPGEGFPSGAFKEVLGGAFPTSEIWYTDATKTDKIVELTITRDAAKKPLTEVWEMYDTDGSTVLVTLTDTIAYSGPFEVSRTRTWV